MHTLEYHVTPATINTVADTIVVDGKVSLREALTSANNNANLNADEVAIGAYGIDKVAFDSALDGSAQFSKLLTRLPDIIGDVNFIGTTAANET